MLRIEIDGRLSGFIEKREHAQIVIHKYLTEQQAGEVENTVRSHLKDHKLGKFVYLKTERAPQRTGATVSDL
jgi:hypothetical protein